MGHPIATTVTLATADADGIAASQSLPGASGLLAVLNGALASGGAVTLDAPRRVIITSAGNDSGITFTVVGTARSQQGGIAQTETVTGANVGAATTTQDFATVTSVTGSAATAGAIIVGTSGVGSGPWVPWNESVNTDFQVSCVGYILAGSPTWQVDYTYDDVFGTWLPSGVLFPRSLTMNTLTGLTVSTDGMIGMPVRASRLTLAAVGSVQLVQTQNGA